MLWSSQVAPGNENALKIRVYGEDGGLEWEQENPNYLILDIYGSPKQTIRRSGFGTLDTANRVTRIPPGHPEGYLEGLQIYIVILLNRLMQKKKREILIHSLY